MENFIQIVLISNNSIEKECWESLSKLKYSYYSILVNHKKPEIKHSNLICEKYLNCSANREEARIKALNTKNGADWFFFADDDVVFPSHTLSQLIRHNKRVIGGYYKMIHSDNWVGGRWVADNVFFNFKFPYNSVVKADTIGLGCALIHRTILENITFKSGHDIICKNELDKNVIVGECGVFGNDCVDLGIQPYLDGDVICKHLVRNS